jgi:hypothetical protein
MEILHFKIIESYGGFAQTGERGRLHSADHKYTIHGHDATYAVLKALSNMQD